MKQAAVCHREAFAGGGVGAGTGPALFREPPPAGAPPSVTGERVYCDAIHHNHRVLFLNSLDGAPAPVPATAFPQEELAGFPGSREGFLGVEKGAC